MNENNVDKNTEEVIHAVEEYPVAHDAETIISHSNENERVPVTRQLSVALGLLALVFGVTYIPEITTILSSKETSPSIQKAQISETPIAKEKKKSDPFEAISLEAKSAYIFDIKNQKVLYKKNADEQLALASITKLMTALVAYELLGNDTDVNITLEAINQNGESGFVDGELFSSGNLLDLTLITSSNDGAYALATAAGNTVTLNKSGTDIFINAMNIRAAEIGLTQTFFKNPTGLDLSESKAGAYGSARDMAFLMEYIVTHYPEILERTRVDSTYVADENGVAHIAKNTNETVAQIPGLIASKTGYTDLAGGNLVVAFDAGLNRPIVIAILGSTRAGRFDDMLTLVDAVKKDTAQ